MKYIIIFSFLCTLFGAAIGCPTCVGRAGKHKPPFFSNASYEQTPERTPASLHQPSIAQKRYEELLKKMQKER